MSDISTAIEKLKSHLDEAEKDAAKFEAGNKSAGVRLRAYMQDIKILAQDIRSDVSKVNQERKDAKNGKTKKKK